MAFTEVDRTTLAVAVAVEGGEGFPISDLMGMMMMVMMMGMMTTQMEGT